MGRKRFLVGSATMSVKDETHTERWPSAGVGLLSIEGRSSLGSISWIRVTETGKG